MHRTGLALPTVAGLGLLYHLDRVLRGDYLGWPLYGEPNFFTASLLLYPILLAVFLLRERPWIRVALISALLGILQSAQMFFETPEDQYDSWAHGVSSSLHAFGKPNLLGISSPAMAFASISVSLLLTAALAATMLTITNGIKKLRRAARASAVALMCLIFVVDCTYAWALTATAVSPLARTIAWRESDVLDYQRFPARTVVKRAPVFTFQPAPGNIPVPLNTVPVRRNGHVVEQDLEDFLVSTHTTAFLVLRDDTLLYEGYFNGYRHDSTVASFSTAKPFISALVGIAIADHHISSVNDAVTEYVPELTKRDPRFERITLRHLLTMTSGLQQLDPYHSVDLRVDALTATKIAEPPGLRFEYNNIDTVLVGLVLERATGRTISAYLAEKLWGPLGMEADGGWNLDSEASGFEQMQTGLSGRAIDFAKFGALYRNRGSWRGSQLVPPEWVAESTGPRTVARGSSGFGYYWWTRPGIGATNDFWTQGNHGQFIYVAPDQGVVLIRFGIEYGYEYWPELLSVLAARSSTRR